MSSTRIDDALRVSGRAGRDKVYTSEQVIGAIEAGRDPARLTHRATYRTFSNPGTVYYTALYPNGSVLTARTSVGVTLTNALYGYDQPVRGNGPAGSDITDFVALWDEGDPNDYAEEWIVVDT